MDIAQWLRALGLEQYASAFEQNHIRPELLPSLTADDLKDIGITSVGHRRQLLEAIANIQPAAAPGSEGFASAPGREARGSTQPDAERRQITVMFCDLVGSTALASQLDPEDLRELIGRYHSCVAQTASRFHGFVAKYMGDGVLIYFGYPHAHEDDAEQAVRAGLALVEAVGALPLTQPSPDGRGLFLPLPRGEGRGEGALQIRVGIATGVVVVGDLIGSGSAQEQAIVGEAPNLAARLQALAEPNVVVIAESTRQQIGSRFDVQDLGLQSLKGFGQPQHVWSVLSENRTLGRFEALRSGATPLIGRDEELDLVLRRWAQARAGSGRVLLISGEPGVGKSRLAEALAERIAAEPHIRLRYFCSPHQQDSALYPVIAQMERAAGFSPGDAPEEKRAKLQVLLGYVQTDFNDKKTVIAGGLSPPGDDPVVDPAIGVQGRGMAGSSPAMTGINSVLPIEDVALLAEMHSLPTADIVPPLDVTPQRKKERTFEALLRQIERLSRQQPVLMVFEDIHWIDPSSRELLDRAIERIADWPVLLVATFRPEFQPPWTGQPHVTTLALTRLDRHDTAAMVANIAGNAAPPTDIVQEIAERTDGVPLFVEELTKAVLESGAQGVAALSAAPHPALSVPATLHASLMARLDRLGLAAKDVAQKGAVIGREFGYDLLTSIADVPEPELRDALDRLVNSGLVFARGTPPQSSYAFKHALVQDAAYGTLLRGRRQQLHARIGTTLEGGFAEIVRAQPALLAQHYAAAGLAEKAIVYWLKAGQQALARSATAEAEALLQKGLRVVAELPDDTWRKEQELELQIALGRALIAIQGWVAAPVGQAYARARHLCYESNRPDKLLPILYAQCVRHAHRAELEQAQQLAAEIRQLGEMQNDVVTRVVGCRTSAFASLHLGDFPTARAYLERALALYDPADRLVFMELGPQDALITMLFLLSWATVCLGNISQARLHCNAALREAYRLAHSYTLADTMGKAWSVSWLMRAEPSLLLERADALLELATEHGFARLRAEAAINRSWCLAALGRASEAVPLLNKGVAEYQAIGNALGGAPEVAHASGRGV